MLPEDAGSGVFGLGCDVLYDPLGDSLGVLPAAYSPDYYEKAEQANREAVVSKALGFAYDSSGVVNEVAAVYNVVAQYMTVLGTGAVDPKIYLPEFIQQLKGAGMDVIVAEKQAQLDRWLASK